MKWKKKRNKSTNLIFKIKQYFKIYSTCFGLVTIKKTTTSKQHYDICY